LVEWVEPWIDKNIRVVVVAVEETR